MSGSGDGGKWANLESVMEADPIGFINKLRRNVRIKDDSCFWFGP